MLNFLNRFGIIVTRLRNVDPEQRMNVVLQRILSSVDLVEMPRNKERSFCCGAGGGRMWMEEKLGTRINMNRVDEAIATGAEEVAVGCPFCRVMVSDGVKGRESDVEVIDVAQALLRSVKNGGNQSATNQTT